MSDKGDNAAKKARDNGCFVNREMSWLEFNRRVLMEADDPGTPLLERLKFLSIYQSNLEEFFMVRVGILTHRAELLPDQTDPCTGWLPDEQLRQVQDAVEELQLHVEMCWRNLREELQAQGIDVLDFHKVSKVDELMSKKIFNDIRPMLYPHIVPAGQSLPFLWGKESYIVAWLGRGTDLSVGLVPLNRVPAYQAFEIDGRQKIVLTAPLVRHFLPLLFKKENVKESAVIRVTRNADVFISDKVGGSDDLRVKMSAMLKKRRQQQPVRLQITGKISGSARAFLTRSLGVPERSVYTTTVPFNLSFTGSLPREPGFRYEPREPAREIGLKKGEYFRYISRHNLLLSYPFQSMTPFVDLLYEAADDPSVESIRITLYRLAANSKVAAALAYATDRGKEVLCLLELRARFDEQNNIDYAEMLEDAGCRVIYGLPDQKAHCKLCLITRRNADGSASHITQIGTGNYNEITGEQYCDLALVTASEEAAADAESVFSALTAGQLPPAAQFLWVAPLSFKKPLMDLLDREIAKGPEGRVAIKVNGLNHMDVMLKLIECSQAGVQVELFIRGICCLRPGIQGFTDNISVKSIVGRWLEHSRIYSFGSGEDERIFIGSGDLLNRNVDRRVEVFAEVTSPENREQVRQILQAEREDATKGWLMQPDGSYIRIPTEEDTSSQEVLYRYFSQKKVSPESEKPRKKGFFARLFGS